MRLIKHKNRISQYLTISLLKIKRKRFSQCIANTLAKIRLKFYQVNICVFTFIEHEKIIKEV